MYYKLILQLPLETFQVLRAYSSCGVDSVLTLIRKELCDMQESQRYQDIEDPVDPG